MSRIGGPFNFGQTALPIALGPGGIFVPPPGNYLVTLGLTTVLQYYDPTLQEWRVYAQPQADALPVAMDGTNWRLVNMSGVVIGANITNAGSGATNGIGQAATGVSVSFGAAPSNGVAAQGYAIVGGAINSTITITNAGSGFVVPPLLLIDPPPVGGIQATAVCTINSSGAIQAVTVTNAGAGYLTAPNVYVVPQPAGYGAWNTGLGSVNNPANTPYSLVIPQTGLVGASGTAQLTVNATLAGSGTVTGIVMTSLGGGYTGTTIPTITITGAGSAAATAVMSLSLTSITITAGGAAYGVAPNIESGLGLILQTRNANVLIPRAARATSTLSGGVINATAIEDPGFGFQLVPKLGTVMTGGTPATTEATLTAVCGGINDVSLLQPAVQ